MFVSGASFRWLVGAGFGWPDRPVRAVGSRSDKKPRHAGSIGPTSLRLASPADVSVPKELVADEGASCRFATKPPSGMAGPPTQWLPSEQRHYLQLTDASVCNRPAFAIK